MIIGTVAILEDGSQVDITYSREDGKVHAGTYTLDYGEALPIKKYIGRRPIDKTAYCCYVDNLVLFTWADGVSRFDINKYQVVILQDLRTWVSNSSAQNRLGDFKYNCKLEEFMALAGNNLELYARLAKLYWLFDILRKPPLIEMG
jgi:hypothetical protein